MHYTNELIKENLQYLKDSLIAKGVNLGEINIGVEEKFNKSMKNSSENSKDSQGTDNLDNVYITSKLQSKENLNNLPLNLALLQLGSSYFFNRLI